MKLNWTTSVEKDLTTSANKKWSVSKLQETVTALWSALWYPNEYTNNKEWGVSKLQETVTALWLALWHPDEYINNKELRKKQQGIEMIMEKINMVEDHFWQNSNLYDDENLGEFHDYFRINYCRTYKKIEFNKEIEKEEEKKVIKNFQNRISIIRDEIFQNPQRYLAIHWHISNPIVIWRWGNFENLIKEMFDGYLIELNAKWEEKDNLLRHIANWLRIWFNTVLEEYYKLWTNAYRKMIKDLKCNS